MRKSDLYREWARVLDMCEGSNVDPGDCWRIEGEQSYPFPTTPKFTRNPECYSFAVAIVEDKPLFVGDELYWKSDGLRFNWHKGLFENYSEYQRWLSWQPPKKTFTLNGEELPCPSKCGLYGFQLGVFATYCFKTQEECTKVLNSINKLLKDATK